METFTFTFSECVENHVGMQQIGEKANQGFSIDELKYAKNKVEELGFTTELIKLNDYIDEKTDDAYILIIRSGLDLFLSESKKNKFINKEINKFKTIVDKKALMYGRVCNKHKRWNLCFADIEQQPDYENGKGTIISYDNTRYLKKIRKQLHKLIGENGRNLFCELNYYYDINKCGIDFHGDTERRKIIGLRIGADFNLKYKWFHKNNPISDDIEFILKNGDMYIMSDKAVGYDWKKSNSITVRHAAGKN